MIKEAIVLAGGLGTRLRSVIKDIPKPMADIGSRPFLSYIFDFLKKNAIECVILSVGYKWTIIKEYFGSEYLGMSLIYAVENEPLGTGGAIKNALKYSIGDDVFILNGDTLFDIDLKYFYALHNSKHSMLSIALKRVENANRYGIIIIDDENRIISFKEKAKEALSLINGGIYILNKQFFSHTAKQDVFSFEKDFLEKYCTDYKFYGFIFDGYFIDIGEPEDYLRAKHEFEKFNL